MNLEREDLRILEAVNLKEMRALQRLKSQQIAREYTHTIKFTNILSSTSYGENYRDEGWEIFEKGFSLIPGRNAS